MLFRRPQLIGDSKTPSLELLLEALAQYGVSISLQDGPRELRSLKMDDIDFIEALQLVESAVGAKVDQNMLRSFTTINEVVEMINVVRGE